MIITTVQRCNNRVAKNITFESVIDYIASSNGIKEKISALRSLVTDEEKRRYKVNNLPAFIFTGAFEGKVNNKNFLSSSGLFCIDIDHLVDVQASKELIKKIPYVISCFVSPSGDGLKVVLKINSNIIKSDREIKLLFPCVRELFDKHGFTLDEARKDIAGLCFASYDPEIYVNYDAQEFDPDIDYSEQTKTVNPVMEYHENGNDSKYISRIVNIVSRSTNGLRHNARLKAGLLAGGYIAGGLVDEGEVRAALWMASDSVSDTGTTSNSEIKTLEDGIAQGKLKPLLADWYDTYKPPQLVWEKPTYNIIMNKNITAFPGVMDAVVKQLLFVANKPQPELTILSALIGMSASIGGNYKLPGGGRLNLYGIGISGTGTGKDKPMSLCVSLASMAGAESIGMPGSGAALEDSLEEYNSKILLNIDEAGHFIAALNDIKQTHMASLSGNLLKLFSASRSFYVTRKLANSSGNVQKKALNPCVSMLGFSCPEKLGDAFGGSANIDDGLVGRILFANGREGVKPRRDSGELHFHEHIIDIANKINCRQQITVKFSHQADELLDELIQKFDIESISSKSPFSKNLKTRSYEKMERISGVLAVWDCPDEPIINVEHVEWAKRMIDYSDEAIIKFIEQHLHGGPVQRDAAKIISIMDKFKSGELKPTTELQKIILSIPGELARSGVLKASHLSKKQFDEGIDHLIALEKISIGIRDISCRKVNVIVY